uniref:Coiled-coil-helix-coiled-coil-helix domain-containing protein 10 n=1 Tax=Schistocephalus solidus TaxID=70667 RepID=A0A0X3Q2C3_SCHSO
MGRRGSPSRPMARPMPMRSSPPPPPPQHAPTQPQQPSLFKQMAATAGGVAVGSAVGHAVGHALAGGSSGSQPETVYAQQPAANPAQNPCQYQIDELVRCSVNQSDISLCSGFAEALKECKRSYMY